VSERIARREVKYVLPRWRVAALRADLAALLARDPHSRPGTGYAVRSLYFETPDLRCLREKLGGVYARTKLRVRTYPPVAPDGPFLLEIKRKQGAAVLKERCALDRAQLDLLLAARHTELLAALPDEPVLRRFVAAKVVQGAVLPLRIDYQREAFRHAGGVYLRATVDTDLRVASSRDLFGGGGLPLGTDQAIFELKCADAPPRWLPDLVRRHRLDPRAVSKFAAGCLRTWALKSPAGAAPAPQV
jgi:hypothetical protein